MNWHRRGAAWLLVLLVSACSSNSDAPTNSNGSTAQHDINDVLIVAPATDEALLRLWDIAPKVDARQAVIVTSPDLTAPVSKDSPSTFQFHLASQTSSTPRRSVLPQGNAPSKWQRGFHEFLQFLAPERIAHAHGTPFEGTAYYLVITDKDSNTVLQVFTPETSFTPEAVDFQHMVDAPQPLTLDFTSAYFVDNNIQSDGGPFVGGKFQIRIE